MIEEGDTLELGLPDETGEARSVADLAGEEGLVLYVYPKDDTPGCTVEATDFRDRLADFEDRGYRVAGVSRDAAASHEAFKDKHDLPFRLLTDEDASTLKRLGAYGEKKNYGKTYEGIIRSTFVLAPDGTVKKAYRNVRAKGHVERVLRDL